MYIYFLAYVIQVHQKLSYYIIFENIRFKSFNWSVIWWPWIWPLNSGVTSILTLESLEELEFLIEVKVRKYFKVDWKYSFLWKILRKNVQGLDPEFAKFRKKRTFVKTLKKWQVFINVKKNTLTLKWPLRDLKVKVTMWYLVWTL